jgi:hypothetical protein
MNYLTSAGKFLEAKGFKSILFRRFVNVGIPIQIDVGYTLHFFTLE